MKLFSIMMLIIGFSLTSYSALGCDEACKRTAAEVKISTKFPSFLSWQYCEDIKVDFMTIDIRSLQSYSDKHFNTKYKGPIKNIVKLISQRKEWLKECDLYLSKTREDRIFYDEKTTNSIFSRMDSVANELSAVINGEVYTSYQNDQTKVIVTEKFETLFREVDDHKNLMHLKGKYVYQ